jgi:hypothetical protein
VATDEQGRYRSGPLTAGDYTLVTALVGNAPYPDMGVQSGPLYLYPGAGSATCDLNAAYQGGRLALELPRPLAPLVVDDRYRIEQRLLVVVRLAGIRYLRWTTAADMPPSWPLYLRMPSVAASGNSSSESPRFWELLGEQDVSNQLHGTQFLGQEGHIPAGKCTVSAVVLADVLPAGMTPPTTDPNLVGYPPIPDSDPNLSTGPYRLRFPGSVGFDDAWTWYRKVFGAHWYRQLQPSTPREFAPDEGARSFLSFNLGLAGGRRDASEVPIQGGQVTRLRLTIPDDFLTRIRQIVDSAETAAAFADKTRQGDNPFVKRVQIEVAGFEPLETESAAPGTSELAQ